ncbi:MAG: right-handed parallel beta-helix repeat-containing protein [Clostridia bacterium]|nr:right-handed parallel beta-helix repeat-containing protein [Clostridia bacterium]
MKTLYFENYRQSSNDAYDFFRFFKDIEAKSDVKIVFPKDTYDFDPDFCAERCLNLSNHGWNGYKRIAVVLENMENVELDFSGSTFVSHGVMTSFAITNCKNITVKNLTLEYPSSMFLQARVIAHGNGYVDLKKMNGKEQFYLDKHGMLCLDYYKSTFRVNNGIEYRADTGEIEYGVNDNPFGARLDTMRFEDIGGDMLRLYGVKRYPPIDNLEILYITPRLGAGFFCEDSADLSFENITIHGCLGMGIIAQTCHNVHLDNFNTLRKGDRYYTANVDGSHFVNCTGLVKVENCTFEGQLDDALNIHGMYARIEKKTDREIFVREVHDESRGIRVYRAGDKIQVVNALSLIPYTEKTVEAAEYINQDIMRLVLKEGTQDISIGDDVENLDRFADLIFRKNTVRNNRARGMLIATKGKTLIEDCYFHTSGSAILFEADGDFWFESGGTRDVTIRNNFFDGCKYSTWGSSVIACAPRKRVEDGKYFHKKIDIVDNRFHMTMGYAVQLDNIEHATFKGNTVTAADGVEPKITIHHVGSDDVETDMKIERY